MLALRNVGRRLVTQSSSVMHQSSMNLKSPSMHHSVKHLSIASKIFASENSNNSKVEEKTELSEEEQKQASEMEALRNEVVELKDKYTRSLAENENVRRRNKKLLDDSKIYAIQSFAKDMLEVADILEKAIESVPEQQTKGNPYLKNLREGVVMTEVQLQTVLKKHGLLKLNPIDEKFDPMFHEAIFYQPIPGKVSGTVAVVQKAGYRLHDRPLRAALVGVVK